MLAGAFTISPWLNSSITTSSFKENEHLDMLPATLSGLLAREVFHGTVYDEEERKGIGWALPLDGSSTLFDGIGSVVRSIYVGVRRREVL
jgi:hypothetical protein